MLLTRHTLNSIHRLMKVHSRKSSLKWTQELLKTNYVVALQVTHAPLQRHYVSDYTVVHIYHLFISMSQIQTLWYRKLMFNSWYYCILSGKCYLYIFSVLYPFTSICSTSIYPLKLCSYLVLHIVMSAYYTFYCAFTKMLNKYWVFVF